MTTSAEPLGADAPVASPFAARMVAIAVASALLMEFVDATALSTALPTLAHAFHTDPIHLKLARPPTSSPWR